jgi:hypothetical protein
MQCNRNNTKEKAGHALAYIPSRIASANRERSRAIVNWRVLGAAKASASHRSATVATEWIHKAATAAHDAVGGKTV